MKEAEIITLSLFSGGGGIDLGFSAVGYNIAFCVDIDSYSCKTLEINRDKREYCHYAVILNQDIRDLSVDDILKAADLKKEEIDFVIGGPPCQAFSVFGRRGGLEDPRGNLLWEYQRIINEVNPTGFVLENVFGLKSIHKGKIYQHLIDALSCGGKYIVSDHTYELAEYGIPQYRKRVFFIGHNGNKQLPPMLPTHGEQTNNPSELLRAYRTVREVLTDMPEPSEDASIPNHLGRNHSNRIIERYRNLRFGERDPKTRINKLAPERPSFTIIVGSDAGGGKGHVHPYSPREVTPRESARLQTFPDWWEFYGKGRHVIRQVGNAVPPLFAALLGQYIAKYIFGSEKLYTYDELIKKLGLDFMR